MNCSDRGARKVTTGITVLWRSQALWVALWEAVWEALHQAVWEALYQAVWEALQEAL